jgi:hypothetical protein
MKNRYFGDISDYLKYGLLRTIGRASGLRLAVCWSDILCDERHIRLSYFERLAWDTQFANLPRLSNHRPDHPHVVTRKIADRACQFVFGQNFLDDLLHRVAMPRDDFRFDVLVPVILD